MNKLILFILITLLLVGVSTAQVVLYSETVSNGTLDNTWYPGFKESLGPLAKTLEPKSMAGNPSGDNWVGWISTFYSVTDTIGVAETFSGDVNWTDFYLEAQLYIPVDVGPVNGSEYFGLEFRVDSTGNTSGYQFAATFNPSAAFVTPGLRFRKRSGGTATTLHTWGDSDVPGGIPTTNGWHKLAVRAIGDQFWFYFNDQEMPGNPYTDTTFAQGAIGVYAFRFDFFAPSSTDTISVRVDDILVTEATTGITDPKDNFVSDYQLYQNYPNPFNPSTTISFYLPTAEVVNLAIYNTLGQKIRNLALEKFPAGEHAVSWDGRDEQGNEVPGSVYFYKMTAGDFQSTKKMLLLK